MACAVAGALLRATGPTRKYDEWALQPIPGENLMMKKTKPVHPGEVLREQFLKPHGLTMNRLSQDLCMPVARIEDIVAEQRRMTADTALRLARYFQTTPEFWLNLQMRYELEVAINERRARIEREVRPLEVRTLEAPAEVGSVSRRPRET
jgi:addiction module HigA family antidote